MAHLMGLNQKIAKVVEPDAGLATEERPFLSSDLLGEFIRSYNRKSFSFSHGLGDHALFSLPKLAALASRLEAHGRNYCSMGKIEITDGWSGGARAATSLAEIISGIEFNDSLVMLKGAVEDPLMGPVLRAVLAQLLELAGPALMNDFVAARATILIASPNRITAYHADSDVNFLMQVSGNKLLNVFDQTDRSLVTDGEVERFFMGEERVIRFLPDRQQEAVPYDLQAGQGVHIPSLAPHWARNKDAVSVAVSFNFDLGSVKRLATVYRVNHQLRRLGLRPRPPLGHEWLNQFKVGGAHAVAAGRGLTRNLFSKNRISTTGN